MTKLLTVLALSAALLTPGLAIAQDHDHHDDRGFYDRDHKDYHKFDDHEDKAWRMYLREHHRKYVDWHHVNEHDQQDYWNWRHNHSDALLKIDIR
jgi:hypothetical protein